MAIQKPKKKPPKVMGIQDRVAKNARNLLLRREFVAGQSREIPEGLATPQRRARQRSIARIKTPSQYATLAEREGRPDLDEAYYEKFLPPTAQLENVAARESVRQLEGVPTAREKAEGVVTAKTAGYVQETSILGQEAERDISVAETTAINERRGIARQAQAVEKAARINAASEVEVARLAHDPYEAAIKKTAAEQGGYEAGRIRVMRTAGVPVNAEGMPDINIVMDSMNQIAGNIGEPGIPHQFFGFINREKDISKAESVIKVYNNLISDATYGSEMRTLFEGQPRWAEFKKKIQDWGMSLYEPAPPVAQPNIPGVASSAGAGAPRRVFGY